MEFQATPWYGDRYTKVTVTGHAGLGQLLSLLEVLGVDARSSPHRLLMLDLRQSQTRLCFTERLRLGQEGAQSLAHLRGFALVVPPDRITGVSEKAAQRMGTNMRVFGSEEEAMEWLTSTSESGQDTEPSSL